MSIHPNSFETRCFKPEFYKKNLGPTFWITIGSAKHTEVEWGSVRTFHCNTFFKYLILIWNIEFAI